MIMHLFILLRNNQAIRKNVDRNELDIQYILSIYFTYSLVFS